MLSSTLTQLTGVVLKQVAFKCGIQTSGTKALLAQRIADEIQSIYEWEWGRIPTTTPRPNMRIVSIDMGIRNLAYCVLDVPAGHGVPKVLDWKRIAVSKAPMAASPEVEAKELEKESFEPHVLSAAAYEMMRKNLLLHDPTHILIERQRFRSMGSPRILEWTVRVNMLESMFYAVLHTLQAEGLWSGKVVPIAPGKVGPFFLQGIDSVLPKRKTYEKNCMDLEIPETAEYLNKQEVLKKQRGSKLAKIQNKGAKIDLVRNWLASGDRFEVASDEVQLMIGAYLEKWERKPGGPKGKRVTKDSAEVVEKMGKLDDLADCLLQGMAFVEWEWNKQQAREVGIKHLVEIK